MDTVRVGIIGGGGIAQAHLRGLPQMADVKLAAFCDVVKEKAEALATQYGAQAFDNADKMMDTVPLDAVFILLPPFAHGDAEKAAISHKLPFLVEKPIGNDLDVCHEIGGMVAKANLMTSVGYMNRYRESVQRAHKVLQDDPPILTWAGWIGGKPRSLPAATGLSSWWFTKAKSGGQMNEQTTHLVDAARYFCGDAVEVYAHSAPAGTFNKDMFPQYTIDDAMMMYVMWERGGMASFCCASACSAGSGIHLNLLASQHSAYFTGWHFELRLVSLDPEFKQVEEFVKGEVPNAFEAEDRAFIQAVKTGDRSLILTDYADAVKTAEITLGALECLETGKPKRLR